MDPEVKKLLEETKALVKDSHRMLRAMRREAWLAWCAKILFWAVIVLVPLYFLQPYFDQLPSVEQFQQLMQLYQAQLP